MSQLSSSGRSELVEDADAMAAFEALQRRAEAATRITKMRARHDAVYAESRKRVPTPAQREESAALQRKVAGPFVDAIEEREAQTRRDQNISKARIVLLSRLRLPKPNPAASLPRAHGQPGK